MTDEEPLEVTAEDPAQQPTSPIEAITLAIHRVPLRLDGTVAVDVAAPKQPIPVVLMCDEKSIWTAVILPPGSKWELRPYRLARKGLWRPGLPT